MRMKMKMSRVYHVTYSLARPHSDNIVRPYRRSLESYTKIVWSLQLSWVKPFVCCCRS